MHNSWTDFVIPFALELTCVSFSNCTCVFCMGVMWSSAMWIFSICLRHTGLWFLCGGIGWHPVFRPAPRGSTMRRRQRSYMVPLPLSPIIVLFNFCHRWARVCTFGPLSYNRYFCENNSFQGPPGASWIPLRSSWTVLEPLRTSFRASQDLPAHLIQYVWYKMSTTACQIQHF